MLDDQRRYSDLSAHDLDIHESSGSGSGSGSAGSIHTPSTVHTAIISILPPTTASTANFPLDIFPSPPKSYNELGPLRSRPTSPDYQHSYQTSNRNSKHRHCRHDRHRRRFSEPTGSSSREALVEQRRYTMSFDYILASTKYGISGASANGKGKGVQEPVIRVGFPSKRRLSIGGTSVSSLTLGFGKFGGDNHARGERVRVHEWQEKDKQTGNGVSNSSDPKKEGDGGKEQDGARVCVYDLVGKDTVQKESISAPLTSPSLPNTNTVLPSASAISTSTRPHTPLWPSLPSGPSSPNSNFTSYTYRQDTPGRVLSGFSDINYSSCSFSVDDHDEAATGVKGDISPTIPVFPLRPEVEDITSPDGISTSSSHRVTRPLAFIRPRPAPLPLGLSLKHLPSIPSASDISPTDPLSGITQTIEALQKTAVNTLSTGTEFTQSVIGHHKDSLSAHVNNHEEQQGSKETETIPKSDKPCFERSTSLPSTRNLPLAEIARPASPSNVNEYIPSTRPKGIGSARDLVESKTASTTIEISVPALASPISIYSRHTPSSSPASMPLSLNRSHQDWDQQGKSSLNMSSHVL